MPVETSMAAAEIAVGLTVVVVALGKVDLDHQSGRLRFFGLFSPPFLAIIFSVFPVVLWYLNLGQELAIRVSSKPSRTKPISGWLA